MMINNFKSALYRLFTERVFVSNSEKFYTFGYRKTVDNTEYSVYERPFLKKKVVAACEHMAVTRNVDLKSNTLFIYPNTTRLIRYKVKFNSRNFPGLIEGSNILQCILIPYMRHVTPSAQVKSIRLVVITDKCQVYHNYPSRKRDCDGPSEPADICKFEESAVWDLPEHRYPTLMKPQTDTEYEYPFLPEESYLYYPPLNSDKNFKDKYGNGGFGKNAYVTEKGEKRLVSRFCFPNRQNVQANSFHHIGGAAGDYKMTLLGTYRSNTDIGVRTVVFATDDGGRQWFCKYEFADAGEYEFVQGNGAWGHNFGNPINTEIIQEKYVSNSMALMKRSLVYPSVANKEPDCLFDWGVPVMISDISRSKVAEVKTETPHGLKTGNIIALSSREQVGGMWALLANNQISKVSGGNGILYKVNVIDEFRLALYECVSSAYNNIPCRHIHHINRIKDGYLLGTGEIYPNGWLFYIQRKEADTFTEVRASDSLDFIRLNSCKSSVQRTLGAIMVDDDSSTFIYASDHDLLNRNSVKVPDDRTISFSRSSTGIYIGKLCDIDDLNNFKVIFEAEEPSFFFKKIDENLVFCGQRGELAISPGIGKPWKKSRIHTPIIYHFGTSTNYNYFDENIIRIK